MEDQEKTTYAGKAIGGPIDGRDCISRNPKGFLLIDKPNQKVWIYEYVHEERVFRVRNEEPLDYDPDKHWKTADGPHYDILAMP